MSCILQVFLFSHRRSADTLNQIHTFAKFHSSSHLKLDHETSVNNGHLGHCQKFYRNLHHSPVSHGSAPESSPPYTPSVIVLQVLSSQCHSRRHQENRRPAAPCFTRNVFKAAPELVSDETLTKNGGFARDLVVNSCCVCATAIQQGWKRRQIACSWVYM